MVIQRRSGLGNLKVLVVDDDAITQRLISDVLKALGFASITAAANAYNAREILNKNEIDVVICDWRMPGMSGVELTRHIRSLPYSKNKVVNIIMLTGNAELENIIEARDAGVTEYLIKPFTVNDLCDRIIEVVEKPREFVMSRDFTGPSRRRRKGYSPTGVERRQSRLKPEKSNL